MLALCEAENWPTSVVALDGDLVTDTAQAFYASFDHRTNAGFRIYPG
ncbi:hypothetical protein [Kribbella sp. CA-293567]|nr:hypothetical protein [Kribbella sp. CA-293567]WBQ02844.1 hypothetical protein OX958_23000 [Kribbella sp. CA-293567]